MRWWMVLPLLLAGCLDDAATVDDVVTGAPTPPVLDAPVLLMDATVSWHDEGTDPLGAFQSVYDPVSQPIAHPCIWDGEPYFNNLHLSAKAGMAPVPALARGLEVVLDWTDEDYAGDSLVVAYRPNATTAWKESPHIPKGDALVIDVPAKAVNETEERTLGAEGWDLWVCLARDGTDGVGDPDFSPMPFVGDLTARVTALPEGPADATASG